MPVSLANVTAAATKVLRAIPTNLAMMMSLSDVRPVVWPEITSRPRGLSAGVAKIQMTATCATGATPRSQSSRTPLHRWRIRNPARASAVPIP